MPAYNAQEFLHNSVQSILAQTYQNWELIAVDDGSNDESYQILKSYARKDHRIKVFRNSVNKGIGETVNLALSKAKGRYIARQDADDISYPQRLEKQLSYLIKNPSVGILGTFMHEVNFAEETITERMVPTTHQRIERAMFTTQAIQNPTVMIDKEKIPFRELWYNGKISPVDELDFFFRLLNTTKFANIPEFLVIYRRHLNNSSLKNIKKTFSLTFRTRLRAIFLYGYRPGLKEFLVHWSQAIVVYTLPNSLLYTLFKLWKHQSSILSVMPNVNLYQDFLVFLKNKNVSTAS